MSSVRSVVRCVARVTLLAAAILGFDARSGEPLAQARSFEELRQPQSKQEAAEQRQLVQALKAFAVSKGAKPGSAEYWSIIQVNLAKSRHALIEGGARDLSGLARAFEVPAARDRITLDDRARAALEAHVESIESGERIFGGRPANPGEFPEVVSLAKPNQTESGYSSFCSGTLIGFTSGAHHGVVLTAAHCVCGTEVRGESPTAIVVFGTDVNIRSKITVAFPILNAGTLQEDYCQQYSDKSTEHKATRDVAYVRFDPAAPPIIGQWPKRCSEPAAFAMLAATGRSPAGCLEPTRIADWRFIISGQLRELLLVGFGYTHNDELGKKNYVLAPVAETICGSSSPHGCQPGVEIVAIDGLKKRDTCNGDSGGPAFIGMQERRFLAAVTSRGGECGTGGIYSLVSPKVIDWLSTDLNVEPTICSSPSRCTRLVE